jgi:hypothetical protein
VPQVQAQDEPIDDKEPAEPAEPDEEKEEPAEPSEPSEEDEGGTDAIAPKSRIRSIRRV